MTQKGRGIQSQLQGHELCSAERKNKGLKEAVKPQGKPNSISLESVLNRVWKAPSPGEKLGKGICSGASPEEEREEER